MSVVSPIEKRVSKRLEAFGMSLQVTLNGHRVKTPLSVLDYNRNGIAFISSVHLGYSQKVRLSLQLKNNRVGPIEVSIHNCRKLKSGEFRYGIQFRTNSTNQLDRKKMVLGLALLEDALRQVQDTSRTILS